MAISSSFRIFSPKFPQSLHAAKQISKPSFFSPFPKSPFFSSNSLPKQPQISYSLPSSSSDTTSSSSDPIEESLPPNLQNIIKLFQSVHDPRSKYEQLLYYGRNLPPLQPQFKIPKNKVQGCVSQVWVHAYLDSDGNVRFQADSDSVLTKGLAALLVEGLSGRPPSEIAQISPDFFNSLGLKQSLTPSRNNGFLNMLRLMQKKALQLYVEAQEKSHGVRNLGGNSIGSSDSAGNSNGYYSESSGVQRSSDNVPNSNGYYSGNLTSEGIESSSENNNTKGLDNLHSGSVDIDKMELKSGDHSVIQNANAVEGGLGSRGERIRERLEKELCPVELVVEDTSYQHAGHAAVRGNAADGETHFNVKVVSKEFQGKSMVKRHRIIYSLLQEELQTGLHALSIVAKTPQEVET